MEMNFCYKARFNSLIKSDCAFLPVIHILGVFELLTSIMDNPEPMLHEPSFIHSTHFVAFSSL